MSDYEVEDTQKREQAKAPPAEQGDADLFMLLLSGKAVTKVLKTARGDFKVKYPMGHERIKIDQLKAMRRGGVPANAFDITAFFNNEVYSTLDVVVIDGPDWWKEAKKNDERWTWEDCPDEDLIVDLYNQFRTFRDGIQTKIRESTSGKGARTAATTDSHASMDDGAFSGIANRPAHGTTKR
jgi:hypothetical protein